MSKSAIYTVMTTPTAVAVDGTIPLGSIARRFGQYVNLNGNGITVTGAGYYKVDAVVTAAISAAGTETVTLLKDGVPIPGATASVTKGAAGDQAPLAITALIRLGCCDTGGVLTLRLDGTAATVNNVAMVVEKL